VLKLRPFIKYWLPVLACMGMIFYASSDRQSAQHSSRIIGPVIRFLFPHLSEETVAELIFLARKCAHLTEFGLLALLVWRALRKPQRHDLRPWDWREARRTMLLVILYAASDEFHQLFVPTRQAAVTDVMIDASGGFFALVLLYGLGRWRKLW
jgi:VanZ family protein